jgi:hypothetical protein
MAEADDDTPTVERSQLPLKHVLAFVGVCVVVGLACGLIWKFTAPVPSVAVSNDGSSTVSNQALSEYFGADAAFMIIGMFAGVALGSLAWRWFSRLGWWVSLMAIAGAALAALATWRFGMILGPHDFAARLAAASAGMQIPIDLTLRTPTAWLLWPLGAIVPVLLYSTLGREDDQSEAAVEGDAIDTSPTDGDRSPGLFTRGGHRLIRFPAFGRR